MKLQIIYLLLLAKLCYGQTLNLPVRNSSLPNGDQFVNIITSLSLNDREDTIYSHVIKGNIPDFQRNLKPITVNKIINSTNYSLTYYVLCDYIAIGSDTNYFLCPMTPVLAQRICDYTNCIMPTRKMVNDIWTNASVKLSPSTIPPSAQMTTVPVFAQHNSTVRTQRQAVITTYPLGNLVGGDKKDVVISNIIYGYPSPERVVIYGWHQLNGSPIQPLYNGHENFYADYSHGIRLVQEKAILNGDTVTISSILQSSTLNSLLSDEGVISVPRYPLPSVSLSKPTSFAAINHSSISIKILITNDASVEFYKVFVGTNGINFPNTFQITQSNNIIAGLNSNTQYFIKLVACAGSSSSDTSEVLGAVTSQSSNNVLIVSGFDRNSTGNTYNFIRQHGNAFYYNNRYYSSATNEAITNNLINLSNYEIVDYILGEESTVNETFSTIEQSKVSNFLDNGGKLFVSGAEIGWDLDYKGTTTDKNFYYNYLKSQYIYDAPNNVSNTYYGIKSIVSSIMDNVSDFNFDNGTNGTYNVDYPDVIQNINGSAPCLYYNDFSSQYAGIYYAGLFPNGSNIGKLVYFAFPFETIYPEASRNEVMNKILLFFDSTTDYNFTNIENSITIYPNPFNQYINIKTNNIQTIESIKLYSIDGKLLKRFDNYKDKINTEDIKKGLYLLEIKSKDISQYFRIVKS